jgi:AcrR family transcriptional regulator
MNKKTRKKAKPRIKTRAYDNSRRTKTSAENKQQIVTALVELLVEKKGGDVTFKEIAERTGLAERSIYRFYEDKETLHGELDQYLSSYLEASVNQMQQLSVSGFAQNAFLLFDKHQALVQAYLYSPFGRTARILFRKKLNKLIAAKILSEIKIDSTPEVNKKIAVISALINAKIWDDIRSDHGFSGSEIGVTIKWAVECLIKGLPS